MADDQKVSRMAAYTGPQDTDYTKPTDTTVAYLEGRGLKRDVIDRYTVAGLYRFNGKRVPAVGFPYKAGTQTAIKWRSADSSKKFSQQNVCEDFFLLETHKEGNSILICEGELDALAWLSSDIPEDVTVVSVPNGAPSRVSDGKIDPKEDGRFRYIWRAKDAIAKAPRIYINTDNDVPGHALAEELARRIGRAKVWVTELGGHKDAAEALQKAGPNYLQRCFNDSKPLPVIGLFGVEDMGGQIDDLYDHGQMLGAKAGIQGVDNLVSFPLGMLSVVTGFPGSGKSDLVDQFCVNMAKDYGYKTVYCSFEKQPKLHAAQLAQKLTGKAFFKEEDGIERMSMTELEWAKEWVAENFMFMDATKGSPTDIDGILDVASAAVMRMGCRILVIDPYNYITVDRSGLETDAISDMLTKVQQWARRHDAHVFFVAHPSKPSDKNNKYICTGLDVAKSMAWFAKADLGLTAWRSPDNRSELHVWKVRWSWMGTTGFCKLRHTKANSRWEDEGKVYDDYDWDFD